MKPIIIIISIFIVFVNCKNEPKYQVNHGNIFGSTYGIQYESDENLEKEIQAIFDEFNQSVSTYDESSKITIFNQSKKGIKRNENSLLKLIEQSFSLNKSTNGYFDPTVSPLVDLWGFGKDGDKKIPTKKEVDSVLTYVGLDYIKITEDSLLKSHPNVQINFNSVTGYCNDLVAELFKEKGINNYLIEIGGEILAQGVNAKEEVWKVGIDDPQAATDGNRRIKEKIQLNNAALATSGNYRKFFVDESGEKVVHTINPKTGMARASNVLSATIITERCITADAVATAMMAMGLKKADMFLKDNPKIKAYLIVSENGEIQTKTYNGFEDFILKD